MALQMTGRLVPATQGGANWLELGDEPAIEVDGRRHTPDDRRRVSARWLSGTVLTGLFGALLISAAAYTALDQQTPLRGSADPRSDGARRRRGCRRAERQSQEGRLADARGRRGRGQRFSRRDHLARWR
jgi:hypothetical protein